MRHDTTFRMLGSGRSGGAGRSRTQHAERCTERVVAPRRAPRRAQPTLASGGRCFAACHQLHAARFPARHPPCAWHAADTQLDGVPPKLRGAVLPDPLPVHIVVRALSTTRRTKRVAQIYRASRLQHRRTTAGQRAPTQPGDTGLVQGCCVALGRAPPLQTRARNASHRTCRWIRSMKCSAGTGADPCHICTGTGAHRCHICTGTGAHRCHICTRTGAHRCHICTGTELTSERRQEAVQWR